MPENGEIRSAGGETRFWNGSGWEMMPNQDGPEPDTFMGGFTKHLLEKEPAARNALLSGAALLAPEAGVATAAAPFVGRGMEYLSKLFRGQNPIKDGSQVASDLGSDALESGLSVYGGPAIAKGARMVGAAKDAMASKIPAWAQTVLHGATALNPKTMAMDALTSKPVLGAVEQVGDALTPNGVRDAFGSVAEGMRPGVPQPRMLGSREVPYTMPPGAASADTTAAKVVQGSDMFHTPYRGDVGAPGVPRGGSPSMDALSSGPSYDQLFGQAPSAVSAATRPASAASGVSAADIGRMPPSMRTFLEKDLSSTSPTRYNEILNRFNPQQYMATQKLESSLARERQLMGRGAQ